MLTINLLSQKLKREVKLRHIYGLFRNVGRVLLLIISIIAAALMISKVILQNSFNRIVAETTLVTKNSQGYNSKVRSINSKLNSVKKIQNDYTPWSYLVEDVASSTPPDVTLSIISFQKQTQTLKLVGHADTRVSLLVLKDYIENNKMFNNLDFPLQNLLQKEDIDFEIKVKLNIDEYKVKIKQ